MSVLRYRVTHTGIAGTPYLSTFHAIPENTTPTELRNAVSEFWQDTAGLRPSSFSSVGDAQVDELNQATGALEGSTPVADFTWPGSGAGNLAPPATQGLLRLTTETIIGGRRIEGKLFLPAVLQTHVSGGGQVTTTYRTAYETAAADLLSGTGGGWCVWSRANAALVSVGLAQVWGEFAVLRSRRD